MRYFATNAIIEGIERKGPFPVDVNMSKRQIGRMTPGSFSCATRVLSIVGKMEDREHGPIVIKSIGNTVIADIYIINPDEEFKVYINFESNIRIEIVHPGYYRAVFLYDEDV
jgi:hypothetical protein